VPKLIEWIEGALGVGLVLGKHWRTSR